VKLENMQLKRLVQKASALSLTPSVVEELMALEQLQTSEIL